MIQDKDVPGILIGLAAKTQSSTKNWYHESCFTMFRIETESLRASKQEEANHFKWDPFRRISAQHRTEPSIGNVQLCSPLSLSHLPIVSF